MHEPAERTRLPDGALMIIDDDLGVALICDPNIGACRCLRCRHHWDVTIGFMVGGSGLIQKIPFRLRLGRS